MPITASDSITLAIEHTKHQLFKPFRIGQWTKLAFVGLVAGELGGNSFNFSSLRRPGATPHTGPVGIDPAHLAPLIVAVLIAALAIAITLLYVASVMRFILFDSIVEKECHIRSGWSRRRGPGRRYFVWLLLYILLNLASIVVLVGIPLVFAFAEGWLRQPKEHVLALVLGGIILFLMLVTFVAASALTVVLTKDFVVPQMALENVGAMEGWRRLWLMMRAEKGAYAVYILLKIALGLAAAIAIAIATLLVALIVAVPTGLGVWRFSPARRPS